MLFCHLSSCVKSSERLLKTKVGWLFLLQNFDWWLLKCWFCILNDLFYNRLFVYCWTSKPVVGIDFEWLQEFEIFLLKKQVKTLKSPVVMKRGVVLNKYCSQQITVIFFLNLVLYVCTQFDCFGSCFQSSHFKVAKFCQGGHNINRYTIAVFIL